MKKVSENDFREYIPWARMNTSNRVYPLSIAEEFQSGDIFVNDGPAVDAVLFWHYCGFCYLSGKATEGFLEDIYAEMMSEKKSRRMVLITDDESVIRFFRGKGAQTDSRIEYEYAGHGRANGSLIQDRFRIEKINSENIAKIEGRIIPAFSWESSARFLENGFGYIALEGETVCAVAFSSAVSSEETDIGVETREEYRGNGLAGTLAGKMCEEIIRIGKKPVWAHAASNTGSMKTALRCGFAEKKRNTLIRCERQEADRFQ